MDLSSVPLPCPGLVSGQWQVPARGQSNAWHSASLFQFPKSFLEGEGHPQCPQPHFLSTLCQLVQYVSGEKVPSDPSRLPKATGAGREGRAQEFLGTVRRGTFRVKSWPSRDCSQLLGRESMNNNSSGEIQLESWACWVGRGLQGAREGRALPDTLFGSTLLCSGE